MLRTMRERERERERDLAQMKNLVLIDPVMFPMRSNQILQHNLYLKEALEGIEDSCNYPRTKKSD